MPSDISPANLLFKAAENSQNKSMIDGEGSVRMSFLLWPTLARLTALGIVVVGAVSCERMLAESLGDHMIAIVLLLIMVVLILTLALPLITRNPRS